MSASTSSPPRALGFIRRQLRTAPRPFAWGAAGTMVWAAATVGSAMVLGWATDQVLFPAARAGEVTATLLVGAAMAVLGVGLARALGVAGRRLGAFVAQYDLQRHDRREVTRRYLALPLTWHRRHATGQLLSNASSDVEASAQIAAPLPMVARRLGDAGADGRAAGGQGLVPGADRLRGRPAPRGDELVLPAADAGRGGPGPARPRRRSPRSPTSPSRAPWSSRRWGASTARSTASATVSDALRDDNIGLARLRARVRPGHGGDPERRRSSACSPSGRGASTRARSPPATW